MAKDNMILETLFIPLEQNRTLNDIAGKANMTTDDIMRLAIDEGVVALKPDDLKNDAGAVRPDDNDVILRTIFIPSEQDQALQNLADEAQVSTDDVIRLAFTGYLKKHGSEV